MKFKIPCQTSLLSLALVVCGAILSDNLQAMSPAASAARKKVLANLQARILGEESSYESAAQKFFQGLGLTPATVAASGVTLPATVSSQPIVGTNAINPAQGFSLMDLAIQNTIRGAGSFTGDGGSAMVFDLLYFGAPAYSFANSKSPGAFGVKLSKSMGLKFLLPSAGAHVGTLYHAIKANNLSPVCAVVATDSNLQIAGNGVNSFWLGAACTAATGCCGTNVCNTDIGVCEASGTPITTCPTVPCAAGYNCVSGSCVLIPVTTCPTVPCAAGYNCVSGSCVKAACVNPALGNCSKQIPCCPGSVCDLTVNDCYIPGTNCFSNAGCQSGFTCSVQGGSIPGSCQKVVACIPGVDATAKGGDAVTPTLANACTPYTVNPNGFNESAAHTSCCAGYTCYAAPEGSDATACQTCGTAANGINCPNGGGADGTCCSGQCTSGYTCQ